MMRRKLPKRIRFPEPAGEQPQSTPETTSQYKRPPELMRALTLKGLLDSKIDSPQPVASALGQCMAGIVDAVASGNQSALDKVFPQHSPTGFSFDVVEKFMRSVPDPQTFDRKVRILFEGALTTPEAVQSGRRDLYFGAADYLKAVLFPPK